MNNLAVEERANLGLTAFEPLDLHLLAEEYGIPIYCLTDPAPGRPASSPPRASFTASRSQGMCRAPS